MPSELPTTFREFESAGWERPETARGYQASIAVVTEQVSESLLDATAVTQGTTILDVATGPGHLASAARARGAIATGIDFSSTQIDLARASYPEVAFEIGDAEALSFESSTFDAVVCAFGMCHFPHPEKALSEFIRVLKPGGRMAFAVWALPEHTVGFGALYSAVRVHGTLETGLPAGPDFFRFSHPEESVAALRATGFTSIATAQVPQVWRVSEPDGLYGALMAGSVRAAATLRAQTPLALNLIRKSMQQVVTAYRQGDHYDVPMPALVASARKP